MAGNIQGMDFSLEDVRALPLVHQHTVTAENIDIMGHMNIGYYMMIFDKGAWGIFENAGINASYFVTRQTGMFALRQFIQYYAEVREGETVIVYGRLINRSAKRLHFMLFMVNQATDTLAASLEVLGSHADLTTRRTSPFPDDIAQRIDAQLKIDQGRGWNAPLCGVIQA